METSASSGITQDRLERGKAQLAKMHSPELEDMIKELSGIAPDLGRFVLEFPYGDILCRPGLDLRTRQLATVAALTALGTAVPQLKGHIDMALNVGCTRKEIVEVVMQMAVYAGFPAALNGMSAVKEIFAMRDGKGIV